MPPELELLIFATVVLLLLRLPILERRRRKHRIRLGLPDAFDLMAICIEAGLSPHESVSRVSKELCSIHPELSEELYLVHRDMAVGYLWDEALGSLSERAEVGEIKELANAVVHAGQLGLLRVLRDYSKSFRMVRRRRARAQAILAAIRSVVPVLIFFMVPVCIVTLGPGFIHFVRALAPQ